MAIYEVTYRYLDEQGRSTTRLAIADAADEAALLAAAATHSLVLDDLSQCAVVEYDYRRRVATGLTPQAGSNIDPGMTFTWASTLAIDPTSQLPDPIEAAKDGTGGVDLSNAQVAAYVAAYTGGIWRLNRNNPTQPAAVTKATIDK